MQRCFGTRIFLKHGRCPLRIFSTLWDKNFSIEISDMPFLCIRFFNTRFFLKHRSVSPRKLLALWNKQLSSEKSQVFFLSVNFFDTRFSVEQRRLAIPNCLGLWDTDFDKKSRYTPLFCNPKTFSIPEVFWITEGLPYEIFRYCETKTKTENRDTHPSSVIQNNFWYPKFSETQKGSPTTVLGTVRQKLWQKIVIHPPLLLSIKVFDTRNFWETYVFPYETFGLRGTKNYKHKKIVSPSYA